jgi:predicted dehydrogenase
MLPPKKCSRRRFLGSAAVAAAGISVPYVVPTTARGAVGKPGANQRVIVGVIGTGIRGKDLISELPDEARVAALCDCYLPRVTEVLKGEGRAAGRLDVFRQRDAERCEAYQDYRTMIDRAKLDAVLITTPDHHHILPAILACQAGMDVYVEKPLSLTIAEGRALVRAVARHGRVCQVGSQQRTMEMDRFACQFVREGGIGKVSMVQVESYPGPMRYAGLPEQPVPDALNWELFCGPTPMRPHNQKLWVKDEFRVDGRLWRGWDLWRSYSGHLMTNWGGHAFDLVQWALGMDHTGPVEIWPQTDGHTGPMRLCPVRARYANGIELRFEMTRAPGLGGVFHGERGRMTIVRNRFRAEPRDLVQDPPDPAVAKGWQGARARLHVQNWLDCIKTRKTPNAPVEVGHRSATICHLANICRELGRKLRWDPQKEVFLGDDEANALRDRPRRKGFELPEIT